MATSAVPARNQPSMGRCLSNELSPIALLVADFVRNRTPHHRFLTKSATSTPTDAYIGSRIPILRTWIMLNRSVLALLLFANINTVHSQTKDDAPAPPAVHFLGLIGEYEKDRGILYVYEKDGKLHCAFGWLFNYALSQTTPDSYRIADAGLY